MSLVCLLDFLANTLDLMRDCLLLLQIFSVCSRIHMIMRISIGLQVFAKQSEGKA